MVTRVIRICLCAGALASAPLSAPANAQEKPSTEGPPPLLVIYREEVKPGRAAAHAVNESAWAQGFAKAGVPQHWLAMTSVAGPAEAWFLSAYGSYAEFQKSEDAVEDSPAMRALADKFSSQEADILERTTSIVAGYRPALSYQPDVKLPTMRFMTIDVVRVKSGHDREFRAFWRTMVEAHTKAKMDEHWAVYESEAGVDDLTFYFIYPSTTLTANDAAGPMHSAEGFRTAVGESGREQGRTVNREAVAASRSYIFRLRPSMSTLPKEWAEADPFWAPKPPEPTATSAKKK